MSGSNGTGVTMPMAGAPSPPGPSSVEHWTFQVDSPFRGPAEIRELAGRAGATARDEAFGAGFGGSQPETEDPFFEALEQVEESETYDEAETEGVEAAVAEADLLEEAPASDHPLAAVFSLPRLAFDAMAKGGWATAIAIGIGAGLRDVNKLTNMIFWFRHPQLIGQRIRADQRGLAREWTDIRDSIVKPALAAPSAPAVPSAPAAPPAPRPFSSGGRTSIPPDGLRWYGPGEAAPELMAFMRKVYDLHVKRSKGDFVDTLPDSAIEEVEPGSGKKARKDAARKAREMLAAARAAIAAEGLTGTVRIGILSAYRSADRQFDIWQGKTTKGKGGFPHYYKETKATRRQAKYGGEHSDKAAAYLAEYMGNCVAAPGYSNHQDGLALDLGTRAGPGGLIKLYEGSWFHDWMKANAYKYQFVPLPSEAWHWTYRPAAGGSAGEAGEFESPAPWPSADAQASEVTPTAIKAGKLEVQRIPLLASHRGRAPDLILRWNDMPAIPAEIDVVVHLHGYSRAAMTLPKHIEVWSGLDLAPVDDASGTGRSRPTLTVLPRGHFTGVQAGNIYRYTFPALTTKDGLTTLVRVALERFSDLAGGLPPKVGRLILTAHSGGGAPLLQILRRHDPQEVQEVHVYDGLYQDATALADWASRHIKADRLAVQAGADPTGAMRVFFRPGTRMFSLRLLKAIEPGLQDAPASIQDRYRVESTTLGHWQIPRQYGWRILADAASDVPEAKRPPAPKSAVKRPFQVGASELPFLPEATFPPQAPDTAEADEAEAWELGESETEGEAELDEFQMETLFGEAQAPLQSEDPEIEEPIAGELQMLASEQAPGDLDSPEALDDGEDFGSESEGELEGEWEDPGLLSPIPAPQVSELEPEWEEEFGPATRRPLRAAREAWSSWRGLTPAAGEGAMYSVEPTLFETPSRRTESGALSAQSRRPPSRPCSDGDIARLLGVPLGRGRDELQGLDQAFHGTIGARFRDLIVRVANEFSLPPPMLAVNAAAETKREYFMQGSPVSNARIGLDYWDEDQHKLRRRLGYTFTTSLITDPAYEWCTLVGGVCHFINEQNTDTGPMHVFRSGPDGLRAMAAWLKYREAELIDSVGGLFGWVGIPAPLQTALLRLGYNHPRPSMALARQTLATVNAGADPRRHFPLTGPGGSHHPLRASVIHAAQAWHLANTVFATALPCPSSRLPHL